MAHKVIDRCKETTSSTGTGNLTLTGAVSGFVSMANAATGLTSNGDTGWFCAEAGAQWEVFLGTRISATELERTTLLASSTGSTINFTAPPVVFSTVPASSIQHPPRMFRAERASSDQSSVTANTWTKVQLNSELFAVGSCFDPTTNFRFTADVSGYYQVSFGVEFAAASGMTAIITGVYKNGAVAITGTYVPPAYATSGISSGAGLVYLDAGDYIELYALANGTTIKFKFGSSTFLSAFLIAKG